MDKNRLLKHSVIGLGVMIVVGLVPLVNAFAAVIGGGVAGYLHRGRATGGAAAGAATGLLWTLVTALLLVVVVVGAGLFAPPGVGPFAWLPAAGGSAYIAGLFLYQNAVVVGMAIVGGVIGGLVAGEFRSPTLVEPTES